MLLGRANGDDEPRIGGESVPGLFRGQVLQGPRSLMGPNRVAHFEWVLGAVACGLGAWLVDPAPGWAVATVLAAATGVALVWWSRRFLMIGAALVGLAGGAAALLTSWQVRAVEQN